jgi:hypothetical protein
VNTAPPTKDEAGINPIACDRSQPLQFRRTLLTCAALVGGIGLIALAGWVLGRPESFSLDSGNIPMAPSTAALLALSASALFLRSALPRRGAYLAGLLINMAVAGIAALLLILSS